MIITTGASVREGRVAFTFLCFKPFFRARVNKVWLTKYCWMTGTSVHQHLDGHILPSSALFIRQLIGSLNGRIYTSPFNNTGVRGIRSLRSSNFVCNSYASKNLKQSINSWFWHTHKHTHTHLSASQHATARSPAAKWSCQDRREGWQGPPHCQKQGPR